MQKSKILTMRDALIERIYEKMHENNKIFFLTADLGAPTLDKLRKKFAKRFINVGIAEQNLINISAGLALEGYIVYAYAIAPFLTMRAFEQIRVNLSMTSQLKELNVNLIGVGTGVSYDISGPTHHCFEDITIMRSLPNFVVFSPSDWVLSKQFVDFSLNIPNPKYVRLDSKPMPQIYDNRDEIDLSKGFYEIIRGKDICIISTGFMTQKVLKIAEKLYKEQINIGVIDAFLLKPVNASGIFKSLNKYKLIISVEDAFINKGGLDTMVLNILNDFKSHIGLKSLGFKDEYIFYSGNRDFMHKSHRLNESAILRMVRKYGRSLK